MSRTDYEKLVLEQFKTRALPHLSIVPRSDWEWLALAQHHGLPTRLLDWTTNALIALYFDVDSNDGTYDAAFITYKHGHPAVNTMTERCPFCITQIELYEPPHIAQRMIAQHAMFTAEPEEYPVNGSGEAEVYSIAADAINTIREELQKLGLTRSYLFPGLDGIAHDLARKRWD
jgi:type I restriction enzyme M protein